jgi:uncharacterized LabA/DUF88 family protein
MNNYAFIDNENVNISVQKQGWKIDRGKLIARLREEYGVTKAYMFMGYLKTYEPMYAFFRQLGYELIFKPVTTRSGTTKGNVDAELVLQAMIDIATYDKAILLTGDGDFVCLVRYLYEQQKLGALIVPNQRRYAWALNDAAKETLLSLTPFKKKLAYRPPSKSKEESTPSTSTAPQSPTTTIPHAELSEPFYM